jgi:hypothetical protein
MAVSYCVSHVGWKICLTRPSRAEMIAVGFKV